jgi:hypothetical protein
MPRANSGRGNVRGVLPGSLPERHWTEPPGPLSLVSRMLPAVKGSLRLAKPTRLDCSGPFRNSPSIRESGNCETPTVCYSIRPSVGRHQAARKVWSRQNIGVLQAVVSGIDTHILPISAVTAAEMSRSAHLATFCAICRTGVVVGFHSSGIGTCSKLTPTC